MTLTKLILNPNHPQIHQNPPWGTFFGNIQHCWKLVLSPLQMGQNYYLARSTGHKCWIWKINGNAWYISEIRACFQNVHWRILEDSGRFLARIPSGNRVLIIHTWCSQQGNGYCSVGHDGVSVLFLHWQSSPVVLSHRSQWPLHWHLQEKPMAHGFLQLSATLYYHYNWSLIYKHS